MSSAKKGPPARQCRIFQWVEAQDPSFAQAIRELCMEGPLAPGRSGGVTFLYPKDKAFRDEIVEKAYSFDNADEAIRLLNSLIIPDALPQSSDFRRPIGNRLGVKLTVEASEPGRIRLADGVELVPAPGFAPMTDRAREIAVWILAKGRPPLSGEVYRPPEAARRPVRPPARGGGVSGNQRAALAMAVECDFCRQMCADRCRTCNPYLAKVVSLLNYLRARQPALLQTALCVIDYNPAVSFYLLLEPWKAAGAPLIPDSALFGDNAWNGLDLYSNAVAEYEAFFTQGAWNRNATAAGIETVRGQLNSQNNPRALPQLVVDVYRQLETKNTIAGGGPVLPAEAIAALQGGKKLWQDEFRFFAHADLTTACAAPFDPKAYESAVCRIRSGWPGNNYAAETVLTNVERLRSNVSPGGEIKLLIKFVNSTDFLYLPAAPSDVGEVLGAGDLNPEDWELYNRNVGALRALHLTTGMVRPSGLSPQALQELQFYIQTHGSLPPDVLALRA